jgi:thiol-disulfide isomerase/thioredoxin
MLRSNRVQLGLAVLLAVFFVLALWVPRSNAWFFGSEGDNAKKPPFPLPEVSMKSPVDGSTITLSKFKGSVMLVNFWATWCPPCVGEMPDMNRLHKELAEKGFTVIGISMDSGSDRPVKALLEKMGIVYPVAMGGDNIARQFGEIVGIPVTFLVDRQGNVVKRYDGPREYKDFYRDIETVLW